MKILKPLAPLLLALSLSACLPESEHPIAPPDAAKSDPRLLGSWINVAEDGYAVFHVLTDPDRSPEWEVISVELDFEGIGETENYVVHVTQLPQASYLNVLVRGDETGYLIGRYEFTGSDKLAVRFAEAEKLAEAVRSGKLKGEVRPESGSDDVRITAGSEEWQAFLATASDDLFGEPMSFERVGPATVH